LYCQSLGYCYGYLCLYCSLDSGMSSRLVDLLHNACTIQTDLFVAMSEYIV
jgi:hypothetical protein